MRFLNILLEQPGPGTDLLTANRPQALNELNAATLGEIAAALGKRRECGLRPAGESKAISLNCRAKAAIFRCYNALPGARWFERRLHVMSGGSLIRWPLWI